MDADQLVFRALADPTRRAILDALFDADGQTVGALVAHADRSYRQVVPMCRRCRGPSTVASPLS